MLGRVLQTSKFVFDVHRKFARGPVDRAKAEWLRGELQRLGPTYIKIGQFISSRSDIFDARIIEALRGLQDACPPAPVEETKQQIQRRLGPRMSKVAKISVKPFACASIGQVHLAELVSGERVVIKVRRPGVQEDVDMDITILMGVLSIMDMLNTENIAETRELLHDFKAFLEDEMDYRLEYQNYAKLRRFLKPTAVILPQFYENLCFEDVIIMSFTPSRRIRDAKDRMPYPERQQLAIRLMDTFIAQLVVHGVMHGDPHEGNLGLSEDGRIVLYDLGNVLSVDRATRLKLRRLLLDILSGNLDDALALMRTIDLFEIRDDVRVRLLLEKYAEYIRTVDINVVLSSSVAKEMQGNLPIKFKSVVFRIIRVFGLLEGICKDIDPKFSYEPIMAKYMQVLSGDGEYMTYRAFSDLRKVVAVLLGPQT